MGSLQDGGTLARFTGGLDTLTVAIVERLVEAIDAAPEPLDRAIKWRQLTFAVAGDFHHWICAIASTKRGVTLSFHFGGLLRDPDGRLVAGSSRFLRKLEFRTADDVDQALVSGFVAQAIERLPFFRANWRAIQAGDVVS